LNVSAALKQKLEQARDLLSHANPSGDLAVVVERALDELNARLQSRRFAQAKSARAHGSEQQGLEVSQPKTDGRRAHVRHDVRRAVVARDEQRCAFVGEDGHRCEARAFLQFHHQRAWALGGADTAENLSLMCRAHNRLLAERELGAVRVAQAIEDRRPFAQPVAIPSPLKEPNRS
jgi:hypothetical protein